MPCVGLTSVAWWTYLPTMWLTSSTSNPEVAFNPKERGGIMCNQNDPFRKGGEGFREGRDMHLKCPWR